MYEFGTDAILSLLARLTFCSLSTGKRCATEFQNTLCFLSHQIQTCSGEFEEEERNQKLPKQPVSMSVALRSPSVFGLRSSVTSVSSLAIGWNTISLRTTSRVVAPFASADSLSSIDIGAVHNKSCQLRCAFTVSTCASARFSCCPVMKLGMRRSKQTFHI
jgi:hypothetical protein